ncbi:MAG: hypothetical protein ACAH95_08055 [Fimbriimonas sp.]
MWLFLPDAFISVTEHETERRLVCVRARVRGDLERLFPEADIAETVDRDYRFATSLPKDRVAQVISLRISKLNYPSFFEAITDEDRKQAYIQVWGAMYEEQNRLYGPPAEDVDAVEPERPRYVLEDARYALDNLDEEIPAETA